MSMRIFTASLKLNVKRQAKASQELFIVFLKRYFENQFQQKFKKAESEVPQSQSLPTATLQNRNHNTKMYHGVVIMRNFYLYIIYVRRVFKVNAVNVCGLLTFVSTFLTKNCSVGAFELKV